MQRQVMTAAEYAAEIAGLLRPVLPPQSEALDVRNSLGRVLASDAVAEANVPAFANSAMDGYAARWADLQDLPAALAVVADLPAGSPENPKLAAGQCARIMTGAPVPDDADTIVQVELTDGGERRVTVEGQPKPGAHIRQAGEDFQAGDQIATAGSVITPALFAALVSAGISSVLVRPKVRVGVIVTGDELVAVGQQLQRGQIFESNSYYLRAAVLRDGGDCTVHTSSDDRTRLIETLTELAADVDFIIMSGGASVGTYDVVRDVLWSQPQSAYRTVKMQPGKPQGWAIWNGTPVVSLPGNPVSTAISYELFIRPLLAGPPLVLTAIAAVAWRAPAGRQQFVPVALSSDDEGRLLATPAHPRGSASHLVTSLVNADGLVSVPAELDSVTAGDLVTVRML